MRVAVRPLLCAAVRLLLSVSTFAPLSHPPSAVRTWDPGAAFIVCHCACGDSGSLVSARDRLASVRDRLASARDRLASARDRLACARDRFVSVRDRLSRVVFGEFCG
ncbi:hypothetical protein GCM10022235_72480 [Kribbella ginsengisoli]|uniref:Secreted protein n=1 Tax=Kribbella ginsengisoli TaxID=363865 RepID=A0ABP6YWU5_9ACTN